MRSPPVGAAYRRELRDVTQPANGRRRKLLATTATVAAGLLVFADLVLPYGVTSVPPVSFLRIPIEGLVGIAVLVLLPARLRQWVAPLAGAVLGVLTILRLVDLGFYTV